MAEKRKMRFSEHELETLKSVFAENDLLLMTFKKFMYQGKLTNEENKILDSVRKENVLNVIKKTFVPKLDPEAALSQSVDLFSNLSPDDSEEKTYNNVVIRTRMYDYLNRMFELLTTGKAETISLEDLIVLGEKTPEEIYLDVMLRNILTQHIDFQLLQIKTLAGTKVETVEETLARLQKDSTK